MDWDSIDDMMFDGSGYLRKERHNQPTDRNDDFNDFATKAIDSKTQRLPNCHYTEDLFRTAQTVFGRKAKHKGGGYDYSDRYLQWDYDKWRVGEKIAQAQTKGDDPDFDVCSVRYYEVILSHFHGKPTIIYHVLAGFNVSDGYSYNVFGYYHPEDEK
jgi:hypothetical protein